MKSKLFRYLGGILVVAPLLLHTINILDLRLVRELEYKLYDIRLRLTAQSGIDPRIVIIDIDEESLSEFGQWPWKRNIVAKLIDTLFDRYNVEVLGLDVVFAEADQDPTMLKLKSLVEQNGDSLPSELQILLSEPSRDEVLAQSLKRHNVVLGYTFGIDPSQRNSGRLPAPLFDRNSDVSSHSDALEALRYTGNLERLQGDNDAGFFSLFNGIDSDGILRRVPLLTEYDGQLFPALSLIVASNYLGSDINPVYFNTVDSGNLEALDIGVNLIELGPQATIFVPFRREVGSFRYVSAADVLNNSISSPEELSGTIALLGTSAAGLVDNRATPVNSVFPGVEIHANIIASLLDGKLKKHPTWAIGLERLMVVATGLLLVFLLPSLGALSMSLVTAGTIALAVAGNLYLWIKHDFILGMASVLLTVGLVYLINIIYGYLLETKSRMQLKQSFGLYVPTEIIDQLQDQSAESLLKSEKKELTVLFTDIRDFTTISESMDPAELSTMMNLFLTPMTAIVHKHGGAIDKYMGDAMMAFWGAPVDDTMHATHAVEAALEMLSAIENLNLEFSKRKWPHISVGIGINSGPMSLGNMGSEFRMAYTVLGDAVNLGSRIEGLTKQYGVPLLISEFTAASCGEVDLCEIDRVRVKGKLEPVGIFYPIGASGAVSDQVLFRAEEFTRGLELYREREWHQAKEVLQRLYDETRSTLYEVYLNRINYFISNPPAPEWDGVFDSQMK